MSKWKICVMFLVVLALLAMPLLACGDDDDGDGEVTQWNLTMAVDPEGSGSTTPAVGVHPYDEGTVVTITATPAEGWEFDKWYGLYVANENSSTTTVTMSADMDVRASFVEIGSYTLTTEVAGDGDGSTDPALGEHAYDARTEVLITAKPDNDSYFISWDGDVADPLSESTSVTMDAAKTVTANLGLLAGPEVSIASPSDSEVVTGTVAISATATDDENITGGAYSIDSLDSSDFETMDMNPAGGGTDVTFTADWDSTTAGDGYHIIYIRATNESGQSTTAGRAVNVGNSVPTTSWTSQVTWVSDELASVNDGVDTEVSEWIMTAAGPESLTTPYYSGTALRFDIDYGDPNPLRFKMHLKTWLVSTSIWIDQATGRMMKQEANIIMPPDDPAMVTVTNEWVDTDKYISHTVIVGFPIDVPDEYHQIKQAGIPERVVRTEAGAFWCNVTEDHLLSDTGRSVTDHELGTGDGSTTEFGPTPTTPVDEYSEVVYVDDVRQFRGTDYTIDYEAGTVTFSTAPAAGEKVTIDYNWISKNAGETLWKINYEDFTTGYGLIKQIDYMYGGESVQVLKSAV